MEPPPDGERSTQPHLTDPLTCGEDLQFNLRAVGDLAEKYCSSCAGYHVLYAGKRMVPLALIAELDRKEMAATIKKLSEERLESTQSRLEFVIAGAADTGLLATAAHAVALLGETALARSRFVILDRCRTPLELCRFFGERHRLTVETEVVDVVTDQTRRNADVILVHSLLRFIPREAHVDVLRKFGRWLRPKGRIVFSSRLEGRAAAETFEADQRHFGEDIRRRIGDGQLKVGGSAEAFDARMNLRQTEQIAGYRNLADLERLFTAAQMPVHAVQLVEGKVRRSGKDIIRRRAIVVLGAPQPWSLS